jgi:uncharacterized protein
VSEAPSVFRPGGLTYMRIPAPDAEVSSAFYAAAFGWEVETTADGARFSDGTGHVIGRFRHDHQVAGDRGVRPYIYVEDIDETRAKILAAGGAIVDEPYAEGELWVGNFRDPGGNIIGFWTAGPRAGH